MNPASDPSRQELKPRTTTTKKLAEELRFLFEGRNREPSARRPVVSFLIGAGFSVSTGVPTASAIVEELKKNSWGYPALRGSLKAPPGASEYSFYMGQLGSPLRRAEVLREFINRARQDPGNSGSPLRINWAHLLLATLVSKGLVKLILTTNFDPLIVDSLALMGQHIRTFDLSTSTSYQPGTLEDASVLYLHGQMHSLFLVNMEEQFPRIIPHYTTIFHEAVRESVLVVVGYSGTCDPVLEALNALPCFPRSLYWVHYSNAGQGLCAGAVELFRQHPNDAYLIEGEDADAFMRSLVLDGLGLPLPPVIGDPIASIDQALSRVMPLPPVKGPQSGDPVSAARDLLRRAVRVIEEPLTTPPLGEVVDTGGGQPSPESNSLGESASILKIRMAGLAGDREKLEMIRGILPPNPASAVSQALGSAYLSLASSDRDEDPDRAIADLRVAEEYGVEPRADELAWLATRWGTVLSAKAELKGPTPEAVRLWDEAAAKCADAIRIKPDMHEAHFSLGNVLSAQAKLRIHASEAYHLYSQAAAMYAEALRTKPHKLEALNNWGNALLAQARLKGPTPEAEQLFEQAAGKYAKALQIKPDYHKAVSNWGNVLSAQARLKGATPEADLLFEQAVAKYAEALRIKPDMREALSGWGSALAVQAKLRGATPEAARLLDQASAKYAEALKIDPKFELALFNLACVRALVKDPIQAVAFLVRWSRASVFASRNMLDEESDFDLIRTDPEFIAIRAKLPEPASLGPR